MFFDKYFKNICVRYKTSLYGIYQRDWIKDPTLQGSIVLRITIEGNGTVSLCKVESSDIRSATLSLKIVARIKKIKFTVKKGAPRMTILYPINFLPIE